ncbi:UDP-N-acetylmuramoyl-L-alanine--D-glutamate ligase [Pleomorphovibrio marinus]|uniref:UDP-N-acetylmuramoyl-L-alanine--D-glutamate ligase n=1 Tax=Pleomorphovibrio marinus TaxID=2164132 RepID=UPI000E0B158D|nr:UDP-N-acetylmuramoyl-L-alanine--D-glutamate ligase [Pleomorphovibrio marinus]
MKKIVILGAGESGVGAALLARAKGFEVFVSDAAELGQPRREMLLESGIDFEEGGHSPEKLYAAHMVIKSPGIPFGLPLVQALLKRGIPVEDELEFGFTFSKGKMIAITGTNGKTTTTLLTYHLLKSAGLDVGLAGNVGKSWAGQLVNEDHDWWVVEVSSFQIEGFRTIKPKIAIILNITPDHLDRYNYKIKEYARTKFRLLDQMDQKDHFIYFQGSPLVQQQVENMESSMQVHPVSLQQTESSDYLSSDKLNVKAGNHTLQFPIEEIVLKGDHNYINSLCAIKAALLAGAEVEGIRKGLKTFKNAAHRMELVLEVDGVSYINDSKGTNVDATAFALQAYSSPMVWIAGGVDKGNDYEPIKPMVQGRVHTLICLGKNNQKLKDSFSGVIPEILETTEVVQAVAWAQNKSNPGDIVLLSPACASFDLFKNYEDRGEQFKAAVLALTENTEG